MYNTYFNTKDVASQKFSIVLFISLSLTPNPNINSNLVFIAPHPHSSLTSLLAATSSTCKHSFKSQIMPLKWSVVDLHNAIKTFPIPHAPLEDYASYPSTPHSHTCQQHERTTCASIMPSHVNFATILYLSLFSLTFLIMPKLYQVP